MGKTTETIFHIGWVVATLIGKIKKTDKVFF